MLKTASERLTENIICTEQAFPEFPQLLFGETTDKSIRYFDASAYLNNIGLSICSAEDFLTNYFHPIHALITAYNLDERRVCINNNEGHLLIDSSLVYLFISFTNPDFLAYLNDRAEELFTQGFSVSDTYLYHSAKSRLLPEVFLRGDNGRTSD